MWKRRLIRTFCIILFLACLAAWPLSYRRALVVGHEGVAWRAVFVNSGKIGLVRNDASIDTPRWRVKYFPITTPWWQGQITGTSSRFLGFYWDRHPGFWLCGIPFWFPVALSLLLLLIVWRVTRKRPAMRLFPMETTPLSSSPESPAAPA